jgi:hypothetical protein
MSLVTVTVTVFGRAKPCNPQREPEAYGVPGTKPSLTFSLSLLSSACIHNCPCRQNCSCATKLQYDKGHVHNRWMVASVDAACQWPCLQKVHGSISCNNILPCRYNFAIAFPLPSNNRCTMQDDCGCRYIADPHFPGTSHTPCRGTCWCTASPCRRPWGMADLSAEICKTGQHA